MVAKIIDFDHWFDLLTIFYQEINEHVTKLFNKPRLQSLFFYTVFFTAFYFVTYFTVFEKLKQQVVVKNVKNVKNILWMMRLMQKKWISQNVQMKV